MEATAKEDAVAVVAPRELRRSRDVRFWIAVTLLLAGSAAFGFIAAQVKTDTWIVKQDLQLSIWLHNHGSALFTTLFLAVAWIHSTIGSAIMYFLVAYPLWRRKERYWLLSFTLALPGGMLLNNIVKHLFNRTRPTWDDPILTLTSSSFPSGHTAAATLFYGFVAVYVAYREKISNFTRALFLCVAIVMVALVGFSRIYLGVHFLSDILGAISLSIAWLVVCLVGVRALAHVRGAPS